MANDNNGAGKWQLAFWLISGLFVISVTCLANAVIANDQKREAGDKELLIRTEQYQKDVICRLTRLETLLTKGG